MTATPSAVDRESFQKQLDELRAREKAHTREGDAIAAARRRLPMVEVDVRIISILTCKSFFREFSHPALISRLISLSPVLPLQSQKVPCSLDDSLRPRWSGRPAQ
jgi:hypothetical protein